MEQPTTFGNYALLDRVSIGGMAEVYRAKRLGGGNQVLAIKRILPALAEDQEFTKMFIDEATIAGRLDHPNIAKIIELGEQDGTLFIAMEYVWGKDMLQIVNRFRKLRQPMPVEMACYVLIRMLDGLDYAHRQVDSQGKPMDIVHRDCSPQNVLVAYNGDVKVIDFGIAKAASRASQTVAGVLKGKFSYMSPEQVRGEDLDRRTDVFACGTVLYELLISDRLFTGASDLDILDKVREVKVPPPSKLDPRIDAALEAIIMRALHKDSAKRYQSCGEYRAALEGYLRDKGLTFTAADMSGWLRKAFSQEIAKELQEIGALRNASGHMVVAAEGTVQPNAAPAPNAASGADLDDATIFDPNSATAAIAAARAAVVGAVGDQDGNDDDDLDTLNTDAVVRPSQVMVAAQAPVVTLTPAPEVPPPSADASASLEETSVVPPAVIAQQIAKVKAAAGAAAVSAPAASVVGGVASAAARSSGDANALDAETAATAPTGPSGVTGATGATGATGPSGAVASTTGAGIKPRTSLSSINPSVRVARASGPSSVSREVTSDTTNTGSRSPLRTSREIKAMSPEGTTRRPPSSVSSGLSHDALFGDVPSAPEVAAPATSPASVTPAPPAVLGTPAAPAAMAAAAPAPDLVTKTIGTAASTVGLGTAVPAQPKLSTAAIAAMVAGGLLVAAFLIYWFALRGSAPSTRSIATGSVVVKGRIVVQLDAAERATAAEVFIDGSMRGVTKEGEALLSLPLGKHEVRVMDGERQLCMQTVQVVDPAKLAAVICSAAPAAPAADGL